MTFNNILRKSESNHLEKLYQDIEFIWQTIFKILKEIQILLIDYEYSNYSEKLQESLVEEKYNYLRKTLQHNINLLKEKLDEFNKVDLKPILPFIKKDLKRKILQTLNQGGSNDNMIRLSGKIINLKQTYNLQEDKDNYPFNDILSDVYDLEEIILIFNEKTGSSIIGSVEATKKWYKSNDIWKAEVLQNYFKD